MRRLLKSAVSAALMRSIAPILVGLLPLLISTSAMAQSLPRTVLVIDEDTPVHPWFRQMIEGFISKINTGPASNVYVYVENLGVGAFGTKNYDTIWRPYFREKYRDKKIGVIVCQALGSIPYALQLRDELWPGTPVILAGVQERALAQLSLPPNVTGFTFRHRLQDMVGTAQRLIPNLKRIVLVGDRLGPDSWWRYYLEDLPAVEAKIQVVDLTGLPVAELRQRLPKLPADAAVAYVGLSRDATGEDLIPAEAIRFVSGVSNRPTFVDAEVSVGTGSIGGLVVSPRAIGQEAARLALRILDGESVSNIPIRDGNILKPIFDWRQLQRWGISEERLPAGSEIRYRTPTAWEQYRWQIMFIAATLLIQSLLIASLLYQRRIRHQMELEIRQRAAELMRMNRRVTAGAMSASIAHEVNQPLTAILSNAEVAHERLGRHPDPEGVREIVADIVEDTKRAFEVIDRIRGFLGTGGIKSETVDLNRLVESTLHLAHGELVKRQTIVETDLATNLPAIAGDRVQLQQVLLNLLINAMEAVGSKPSPQRKIKISTRVNGTHVETDIVDFGDGISANDRGRLFEPFFTTKESGLGLGLSICSMIVRAHGGKLSLQSNGHGGATAALSFSTGDTSAPA